MAGIDYVSTLGTPAEDQVYAQEIAIQKQFYFGVPTQYLLINEGSASEANAYAAPSGHILLGIYLYKRTIAQYGGLAVAGVLAHEGGHRVQQMLGWNLQNPIQELEADAFSGFYQALVKRWAWSQIQGYFANVYASGDYGFNTAQHHGTPNQRLASAYMGVNLALYALQLGRLPTWLEMHQAFIQGMPSILAQSLQASRSPDLDLKLSRSIWTERVSRLPLSEIAQGRSAGDEVRPPSIREVPSLLPRSQ